MKITIACKYFSPRGGAQTFLKDFARGLRADGHRVKLVTMEAEGDLEGIETRIIRLPPVPRALRDLAFARATERELAHDDSDVSFAEQRAWGANVVRPGGGVEREYMRQIVKSYPTALMRAIRSVTTPLSLKELLNIHIERKLFSSLQLRCVIANSEFVKRQLLNHYPSLTGRVVVVHNGTDCERFTPELKRHRERVRKELAIPEDALVGAFVSYDFRRKGLPTVLRALSVLKRKPAPRAVYAIVVGKRKGWAERLARKLNVEDRVRFVGPQKPEPYYGASDLALMPSYFDTFGFVVLEGMACGLPAITSIYAGAHELTTPGVDGFFVSDASDAAQLAGFIEYFMDAEKLAAASQAARAVALKNTARHQYDGIMAAMMPVAEQLARERGRAIGQ